MDARTPLPYVIITPANNEEQYIEKTIESVLSQTVRPRRWVVVDDGSTDGTAGVVSRYLTRHTFMRLVKVRRSGQRNFSRKVAAFNVGVHALEDVGYSCIGNLDADVSFAPHYYENILAEFGKDPRLGVAGGIVYIRNRCRFMTDDNAHDSVGGAVQLFRRECFVDIGGYLPLPNGGIDAAAEIVARMKGWTVRKFPANKVWEHRWTGSAGSHALSSMYKLGVRFHTLGYGTTFFIFRSAYKIKSPPFILGSALSLLGFAWARLRRHPMFLPPEVISYLRSEQTGKLRDALFRPFLGPSQGNDHWDRL